MTLLTGLDQLDRMDLWNEPFSKETPATCWWQLQQTKGNAILKGKQDDSKSSLPSLPNKLETFLHEPHRPKTAPSPLSSNTNAAERSVPRRPCLSEYKYQRGFLEKRTSSTCGKTSDSNAVHFLVWGIQDSTFQHHSTSLGHWWGSAYHFLGDTMIV